MKPIWERPRPKLLGKPKKLSTKQKAKAKAYAKKKGQRYPSLVANIRASRSKA